MTYNNIINKEQCVRRNPEAGRRTKKLLPRAVVGAAMLAATVSCSESDSPLRERSESATFRIEDQDPMKSVEVDVAESQAIRENFVSWLKPQLEAHQFVGNRQSDSLRFSVSKQLDGTLQTTEVEVDFNRSAPELLADIGPDDIAGFMLTTSNREVSVNGTPGTVPPNTQPDSLNYWMRFEQEEGYDYPDEKEDNITFYTGTIRSNAPALEPREFKPLPEPSLPTVGQNQDPRYPAIEFVANTLALTT